MQLAATSLFPSQRGRQCPYLVADLQSVSVQHTIAHHQKESCQILDVDLLVFLEMILFAALAGTKISFQHLIVLTER